MTAYIEGIGVISRCAQSADDLVRLLKGGECELADMPIQFDSQIPPAKMRRNSRYNKLACTAADNAVREAAIPDELDRRRIGTIVSTGYGASVYNAQFADSVVKGVPGLCSPAIYSGTVPNSCVGQICILNGFKGASTLLTGGDPTEYTALLLATNKADMILCGSVEEYNAALYDELGRLETLQGCELSEGAAMLMLSREKTEKSICRVSGFSSANLGKSPLLHRLDNSASDIISDILKKYGSAPDAVLVSANGSYFDDMESAAIKSVFPGAELVSPKNWSGETLGCGYMMNTAFAAAAIKSGMYDRIIVTGVDMVGNYCTAMIEGA